MIDRKIPIWLMQSNINVVIRCSDADFLNLNNVEFAVFKS